MTPAPFPIGGDPAVLAEIHAASFSDAWDAKAFATLLAAPGTFALYSEGGFVLVRTVGDEAEILTLAVQPDRRRRGLAARLVHAASQRAFELGASRIFLEVAVGNAAARALYTGLGFAEVGSRRAYYAAGPGKREDALILRSNLPLSPLGKRLRAG